MGDNVILLDYFKQYLKASRGVTDKTVNHYVTGLNTVNLYLDMYNFPIRSVFEAKTVDDLKLISQFLDTNEEFVKQNKKGHNMYSVAFKHFLNFAIEDKQFFSDNIAKMDVVVAEKPQIISVNTTTYRRNQIIVTQALEGAHFCCEHDESHKTFLSASTGKQYMEGHHLIPLKYQNEFDNSIDVYANIVCLCPICHRMLHYGTKADREYAAEKLLEDRNDRLIKSGIDLSKKEFLKMAVSL